MSQREPKLISRRRTDGTYAVLASDGAVHYQLGTVRREDLRGPKGGTPHRWHLMPAPGLAVKLEPVPTTLGAARGRLLEAWLKKRRGAARTHGLPGTLIAVEGGDGAGKTTLVAGVARRLVQMGHTVSVTEEPSRGPLGKVLRESLAARGLSNGEALSPQEWALLYAADRAHHLREGILPALARGEVVVCSRYTLSSLAYQGPALGLEWVDSLNQHAPEPDVYLFLDVPLELALARLEERRSPDAFENERKAREASAGYARGLALLESRGARVVLLDARLPPETLAHDAAAAVLPLLKVPALDAAS